MPFISCYIIYYYLCGTTTSCLKLQVNSFLHLVSSIVICSILCCIQDHLECLCLWFWWHILLCKFLLLWLILHEIPFFPTLETYLSVVHVLIRIVTRSSAPIAGHFYFAFPNMLFFFAFIAPFYFVDTPGLLSLG